MALALCFETAAETEAHSVMDPSTLFHFRCATQLSNAPYAEFSACRNLDSYLPSLIHPLTIDSSSPFPPSLRSLLTSMYNANTRSSQTPTRRGPCSFREDWPSTTTTANATSSSVTTTRDQRSTYSTSIVPLRTKARLKRQA
ncbi:hypothetical protein DFH09DRAFT_1313648 [Mycena vulgaris]|nr:hypothetical protein DFH09DRAFT_1313648 [Mycena vulgaris]